MILLILLYYTLELRNVKSFRHVAKFYYFFFTLLINSLLEVKLKKKTITTI